MTTPQTPEQLVVAIDGYRGMLVAGGIRLPVTITARVVRDEREVGPTPDGWRQYEAGPATIECRLTGVPEVGPEATDRRQRAREAFFDALSDENVAAIGTVADMAIETATRVRITPEALRAMMRESDRIGRVAGLAAALTELGFEVEG